jgi:hypothetical protein
MQCFRTILCTCGLLFCISTVSRGEETIRVTVCDLKTDPESYNHKLIEVTGFVSHGFEDFGLFDPNCPSFPYVWLEFGGTKKSGTMYCCGVSADRNRPKELVVEGIELPLTANEQLESFDNLLIKQSDTVLFATIVGRFFAGKATKFPNGREGMHGFGHLGCCSLFVIEKVISVAPHDREDLDYRSSSDQPKLDKVGCGYQDLVPPWPYGDWVNTQQTADLQENSSAFDNSRDVAGAALIQLAKLDEAAVAGMKETQHSQGRFIYELKVKEGNATYMIVLSKPYLLSFFAKDPRRVAWVVIGAYKSFCEKGNSINRIE